MSDAARLSETITDDLADIGRLADKVAQFLGELAVPAVDIAHINLAIEELATNAVRHGFGDDGAGGAGRSVKIAIRVTAAFIVITIEDEGPAFDPFARASVDISQALIDRPIGGLGIHLVREFMDHVRYRRVGERNHVTLHRVLRVPPNGVIRGAVDERSST